MNSRSIFFAAALLIAGWLAFFADKTPDGVIVEPAKVLQKPRAQRTDEREGGISTKAISSKEDVQILALRGREPFVRRVDAAEQSSPIFGPDTWSPAPLPGKVGPPPVPVAPPLPYTFIGKKLEDGIWEVYLAAGEDTRVVRQNTTLDRNYRIDAIAPPTLRLTYLPLMQVQNLSIGSPE